MRHLKPPKLSVSLEVQHRVATGKIGCIIYCEGIHSLWPPQYPSLHLSSISYTICTDLLCFSFSFIPYQCVENSQKQIWARWPHKTPLDCVSHFNNNNSASVRGKKCFCGSPSSPVQEIVKSQCCTRTKKAVLKNRPIPSRRTCWPWSWL